MTTTVADNRTEFISSMRELLDWLTDHPEVKRPYHLMGREFYIYLFGDDSRAQLATIARAMGKAEKRADGDKYRVSRKFGTITLIAQANRADVCERVVVGTREVEVEEPDPAALAALPKVKRTAVVEDVEWVCGSLLADPAPADDFDLAPVVAGEAKHGNGFHTEPRVREPNGGPSHPDVPAVPHQDEVLTGPAAMAGPSITEDAWDDAAYPVPAAPFFDGSDAALQAVAAGDGVMDTLLRSDTELVVKPAGPAAMTGESVEDTVAEPIEAVVRKLAEQ
jgi:hypothetical protein